MSKTPTRNGFIAQETGDIFDALTARIAELLEALRVEGRQAVHWQCKHERDTTAQAERIAELKAMLTQLEWKDCLSGYDSESCPMCGMLRKRGHDDGCELGVLLPEEAHDETPVEA